MIECSGQVTKNKHFRYPFIISELKSNSSQEEIGAERQEKLTTTKPQLQFGIGFQSPIYTTA